MVASPSAGTTRTGSATAQVAAPPTSGTSVTVAVTSWLFGLVTVIAPDMAQPESANPSGVAETT